MQFKPTLIEDQLHYDTTWRKEKHTASYALILWDDL